MSNTNLDTDIAKISVPAVYLSIVASVAVLIFLASLHLLSPEFDPSWRVVSEYAKGQYGWVLSLMFVSWAIGSWALAFAIRSQIQTPAGKTGLILLIIVGIGEAMASLFNINHPLHDLAGVLGVLGLPVAAMLISVRLSRTPAWSVAKKVLLWTANLTWVSLILMIIALVVMIISYTQAGGKMTAKVAVLPPGVIAWVGWANRFLVIAYCVWAVTVARQAIRLRR